MRKVLSGDRYIMVLSRSVKLLYSQAIIAMTDMLD